MSATCAILAAAVGPGVSMGSASTSELALASLLVQWSSVRMLFPSDSTSQMLFHVDAVCRCCTLRCCSIQSALLAAGDDAVGMHHAVGISTEEGG